MLTKRMLVLVGTIINYWNITFQCPFYWDRKRLLLLKTRQLIYYNWLWIGPYFCIFQTFLGIQCTTQKLEILPLIARALYMLAIVDQGAMFFTIAGTRELVCQFVNGLLHLDLGFQSKRL